MYLVRDLMYCKPGKVRALVQKMKAMGALSEKLGMPKMRLLTDFSGEQYWTIVVEMEVESLDAMAKMMSQPSGSAEDQKQMEQIMSGYHDLVDRGRREIFRIEG